MYRNEFKGKKPIDWLEDPPTGIDLSNIAFDDIHINQWRKHGVDYETAKKLMADATFSLTRGNGRSETYFSNVGAVYILDGLIQTAFLAEKFDEEMKKMMAECIKMIR